MATQMTDDQKAKFRALVEREDVTSRLERACSRYVKVPALQEQMMAASIREPRLMMCAPTTIVSALFTLAQLGLQPGPKAHLVPFNNSKRGRLECQFILDYKGMLDIAARSKRIRAVDAKVVYTDDDFACEYGGTPYLKHNPMGSLESGKKANGDIRLAYAIAWIHGLPFPLFVVMTKAEIDAIKARAKSKSGPWVTDYAEMARKTPLRRLFKYLPLSSQMEAALDTDMESDEQAETAGQVADDMYGELVVDAEIENGSPALPQTKSERLATELAEKPKPKGMICTKFVLDANRSPACDICQHPADVHPSVALGPQPQPDLPDLGPEPEPPPPAEPKRKPGRPRGSGRKPSPPPPKEEPEPAPEPEPLEPIETPPFEQFEDEQAVQDCIANITLQQAGGDRFVWGTILKTLLRGVDLQKMIGEELKQTYLEATVKYEEFLQSAGLVSAADEVEQIADPGE